MSGKTKTYSNGEITVFWKPDICIHSENCFRTLGAVFDPDKRPWINVQAANTGAITKTINGCPSKALTYRVDVGDEVENGPARRDAPSQITIMENGPYLLSGDFVLKDIDKIVEAGKTFALCRCGASRNKPFCDGAHKDIKFQG
jgi:uncharacterized Fe-S cluster protein YjdI